METLQVIDKLTAFLIALTSALGAVVAVLGFLYAKKQKTNLELLKVFDKSDPDNKHFLNIASAENLTSGLMAIQSLFSKANISDIPFHTPPSAKNKTSSVDDKI